MRILIVCDYLLKYGSQQARSLVRLGHDVAMLCRSHAGEFGGLAAERDELVGGLRGDGIRVLVVPGRVRSISAVPHLLGIRRELHRWQPEIVHAHENHDPRLLALTSGYRTVLTVHDPLGHPGAPLLNRGQTWAFRRWFRRAESFAVHGRALAEELAPIVGDAPIAVIPHGVAPRPAPLPPPASRSVLLFGRLEQYKGVEVLVEGMPFVWERRPDVRLVVAGDGPAARHVPADPRISLLAGYVPEGDVETLLAGASLVALPYTQASQSGVGALAIASGVPVVVSNLGALPDLTHDPSCVVEAGDPRALAGAIVRHLDDGPDVRAAVLRHARSGFSWERAAQLSIELYRGLVEHGRRSPQRRSPRSWMPQGTRRAP